MAKVSKIKNLSKKVEKKLQNEKVKKPKSYLNNEKRKIYFGEENSKINWKNVEDAIFQLNILQNISDKPIILSMTSAGGEVYEAFRLVDAIEKCRCKVIFVGSGLIASAAVFVMVSCDKRLLTENSYVMVHSIRPQVDDIYDILALNNKRHLQKQINELFTRNTTMSYNFWNEIQKDDRDLYLTAEEALKLGLADQIIKSENRENYRKIRNNKELVDDHFVNKLKKRLHIE